MHNPLELAISMNKNKIILCLAQIGFNINKATHPHFNTPLHLAVLGNNLTAVKILLDHGATLESLNIYQYTPFLSCMENGDESMIRFFLTHFPFWRKTLGLHLWASISNQCPIRSLIRNRDPRVIQYVTKLLQGGVSPNIRCSKGKSPLLEVMYTKDIKTATAFIKTLNRYDADVNYFNSEGICPLFKAVSLDDPTLLKTLIENKSLKIDLLNMFRLTSLFYAVSNSRNLEIIEALMKANADPCIPAAFTMRDIITDTASAMLQAVIKGRFSVIQIFFEYGYVPKRSWFFTKGAEGSAWNRASKLAQKVPSLKSLSRKSVKNSLTKGCGRPTNGQLLTLELPRSLTEYIAFL